MASPSTAGVPGHATPEGTRRYAERHAGRTAAGHFREAQRLVLSSIGIGTYLGRPDEQADRAYTSAVAAAVRGGVNVIDSAINYRFQRSERSIGAAIRQLAAEGFRREEFILCTKGGYLTPDGDLPGHPQDYFLREYVETGILAPEDVVAGSHAMTPRYLEDQLQRSLRNLGVECVDVYYVHNPETQLGAVPRSIFRDRISAAFAFLEAAVAAGRIRYYGIATWNGLRQPAQAPDHVSLADVAGAAREVAGDGHHFRFVQLPYNFAMLEALAFPNQVVEGTAVPIVEAAQRLDITLVGSAALLQGRLAHSLPRFVTDVLGLESDRERALQFARSSPGLTTALVGMGRPEHVAENLRLVGIEPASRQQLLELFGRAEGARSG